MTFSEFYETFEIKSDKGTIHDYINAYYSNEFTSIRNDKLKIGGKLVIEDIQSNFDLKTLTDELHKFNYSYKVFDFTKNKGRYDDIILEIIKK